MEQEIKIRRVDFYPTDWLEGTIDLTHIERSVYITICAAIYAHGGPVKINHVRRLCPGRGFQQGLKGLLKSRKVIQEGAMLTQARALIEVGRAQDRIVQAHTNGDTPKRVAEAKTTLNRRESDAKVTRTSRVNRHTGDGLGAVNRHERRAVFNDFNGVLEAGASLARGRAIAHQTYNHLKEESYLGDGDSEEGRSAPLEEDATPPRRNGKSSALKAAIRDQLMQKHGRFLAARARPEEIDAYWLAMLDDDPTVGKAAFEAIDARMRGEGWDDARENAA